MKFTPMDPRLPFEVCRASYSVAERSKLRDIRASDGWISAWAFLVLVAFICTSFGDDQTVTEEPSLIADFKGLESPAISLAISADNKILVSGSEDGTARLWDVRTGAIRFILRGNTKPVNCVALSSDNRMLATASLDGTVKLWNITSGEECCMFQVGPKNSVVISPDGMTVAAAGGIESPNGHETRPVILDLQTKRLTASIGKLGEWHGTVLAFSPDGKHLAAATGTDAPRLWDAVTGELREDVRLQDYGWKLEDGGFERIPRSATCMTFSRDGKMLAVGTWQNSVWFWNLPTGKLHGELRIKDSVECVAVGTEGRTIAASGMHGGLGMPTAVRVWDTSSMKQIRLWQPHARKVRLAKADRFLAQALSADAKLWATACADNTIKVWRLDKPGLARSSGSSKVSNAATTE
jgi:WD40 repeat protein